MSDLPPYAGRDAHLAPVGVVELRLPRGVYLVDVGDEHLQRVFGWYYGYDDEDGDFDWEDWEG